MPCGRPTLGRPVGRLGVVHPYGVFGVSSYYQLIMLFLNMVFLAVVLVKYLRSVQLTIFNRIVFHGVSRGSSTASLKATIPYYSQDLL
jgi:hypothetical protein